MKLQRMNRRALALGALAVSGALALTACGSDDTGGNSSGGDASAAANSNIKCEDAKGQLQASGSSAQKNAIDAWVKQYVAACNGVQINYNPTGSGAGITAFTQGQTAFAGSDSALKPEEIEASKKICSDGQGIDLPMVGGPIAVGYDVTGVDDLVLDAPTLAKIFDSKITNWNDEAIAKLNPDAKLPDMKIQAFHRSDDSGTTDNFTKYLSKTAEADWTFGNNKAWKAPGGVAATGSDGVAAKVKSTAGTIAYVELSFAENSDLSMAKIKNGAGEYTELTGESAGKTIAGAKIAGTGDDLKLEIDYATKEAGAYPIVLVTYEIACSKGSPKAAAIKGFLSYTASTGGQSALAELGYAPLPVSVRSKVEASVAKIA